LSKLGYLLNKFVSIIDLLISAIVHNHGGSPGQMMPHGWQKQRRQGVGDSGNSGGDESSGTTMTATTGNKDYNAGRASRCHQQRLLAQHQQSRQQRQLIG
jgi:hypothetical protein